MKREKAWTKKEKKFFIAGGLLAVVLVVLCCCFSRRLLELMSKAETIRLWVQQHPWKGRLAYVTAVVAQVVLAVIPGEPLEIVGGYAFGVAEGTLLCLLGATVGSITVFGLVRRLGAGVVNLFFSGEKLHKLRFLQHSPKRILLFCLIFVIPGTPKDLLCYYAGLTDIRLPVFLMICSVGRLPSLVTSTLGGDAVGVKSYLLAVVVFVVTLLISGAGVLAYDRICKRYGEREEKHARKTSPKK